MISVPYGQCPRVQRIIGVELRASLNETLQLVMNCVVRANCANCRSTIMTPRFQNFYFS